MGEIITDLPCRVVSPIGKPVIHRFFDTSPFSPSGRYLGLIQFPTEDRLPEKNDAASILVIDLEEGTTLEVDQTRAWDTQLGAHVQWGWSDETLIYNQLDSSSGKLFGRIKNPTSGSHYNLEQPVYMVEDSGNRALTPNLFQLNQVQAGYGVFWAGQAEWNQSRNREENGIWSTDLRSGKSTRILSIQQILDAFPELQEYEQNQEGEYVCFHVKWNPQGTRIFTVFRFANEDRSFIRNSIITLDTEGKNLALALPPETWLPGGHHPNWCPDGERILMNLQQDRDHLDLVRFRFDGSGLETLSRNCRGSGHPTLHPDGRHILTDCYPYEVESEDKVPLRWIDLKNDSETSLAEISCVPPFTGPKGVLRIDPHPAWDKPFTKVAVNAYTHGTRSVAVLDLSEIL